MPIVLWRTITLQQLRHQIRNPHLIGFKCHIRQLPITNPFQTYTPDFIANVPDIA
jgi:hypothetical protein